MRVMPDYHRYGLGVGEAGSGLVGEWTAKFPRGGGDLSLPKQHTFLHFDRAVTAGFVTGRHVGRGMPAGDCTTSAPPIGGEL